VRSTAEVGPMTITKFESKGKSNKRLRVKFEKVVDSADSQRPKS
jgi:Ser-tRNA(Ala) deacylase AlaX